MSSVAYGLIATEVQKVDSGYRPVMRVQSSLVMAQRSRSTSQSKSSAHSPPVSWYSFLLVGGRVLGIVSVLLSEMLEVKLTPSSSLENSK